jgi:hypothetical protein
LKHPILLGQAIIFLCDEKKGIGIKKGGWEKLHVHISQPLLGLASSAAGFACLGKSASSGIMVYLISVVVLSADLS